MNPLSHPVIKKIETNCDEGNDYQQPKKCTVMPDQKILILYYQFAGKISTCYIKLATEKRI